ncbi:hypothetical protein JCM8097_006316 [Rhodosporidiobolus ruineniae]
MSLSTPPPHAVASRALLQAVATLVAHLDPAEGASTKTAKRVKEDVDEVLKEHEGCLPAPAVAQLRSALSSLSSSSPTPSFNTCTAAVHSLTAALHALSSSVPVSPPAAHRLPNELLHRIVGFVQEQDGPARQRANLALARTCRGLHKIVEPILKKEIHLSTPGQLERLAEQLWEDGAQKPLQDLAELRTLTMDLKLRELKIQPDCRWPGRHIVPLLDRCKKLEVLRVLLWPTPDTDYDSSELPQALGCDYNDLQSHFLLDSLKEVHLPYGSMWYDDLTRGVVFRPPDNLEVLRIGLPGICTGPHPDEIGEAQHAAATWEDFDNQNLKLLAMPFWELYAEDLLALLVGPVDAGEGTFGPALDHLEVSLRLHSFSLDNLATLSKIFDALSPSINRLELRIRTTAMSTRTERQALHHLVLDGLSRCKQLESLKIGGAVLEDAKWSRLSSLPRLSRFTYLLFSYSNEPIHQLTRLVGAYPRERLFEHLGLVIPPDPEYDAVDGRYLMKDVRELGEKCKAAGPASRWRRRQTRWLGGGRM